MYKTVAGWVGWEPEIILTTTISQLELAVEGKIDFVRKTNPFGNGGKTDEEKLAESVSSPEIAAKQLLSFVKRRQSQANRTRKK